MSRRRIAALTAALALALAGVAPAEEKSAKSAPSPSAGTSTKSSVPVVPVAAAVVQKPDLVVTFEGGGPGLPTGFTVKNVGNADSKLSVLKVTATLMAPEAPPQPGGGSGDCFPFTPEQCAALASLFSGQGGGPSAAQVEKMKAACGNPFPEFLEAVPVLKPGESKTFTRNVGPYQVAITGIFSQTGSAAGPQITRVKQCPPTLICAWHVKAVADASNDNDERNEGNNTATKQALREVSFK